MNCNECRFDSLNWITKSPPMDHVPWALRRAICRNRQKQKKTRPATGNNSPWMYPYDYVPALYIWTHTESWDLGIITDICIFFFCSFLFLFLYFFLIDNKSGFIHSHTWICIVFVRKFNFGELGLVNSKPRAKKWTRLTGWSWQAMALPWNSHCIYCYSKNHG